MTNNTEDLQEILVSPEEYLLVKNYRNLEVRAKRLLLQAVVRTVDDTLPHGRGAGGSAPDA